MPPSLSNRETAATRLELLTFLVEEREMLLCDAIRILGSRDRAEDVVQDAAIRCLDSGAIGPALDNPRGMVRRIVRNLALDHLRRTAREMPMPEQAEALFVCPEPGPERRCEDRQVLGCVLRSLESLPPAHRKILLDHRLGGRRQNEIAGAAGLSPARINAIIARSHGRLAAGLAGDA